MSCLSGPAKDDLIIIKTNDDMTKMTQEELDRQDQLTEKVNAFETFYNEKKGLIWGSVAAVLVVIAGALAFNNFVSKPKQAEAAAQMYPAEASFANGEFELALNGDGNVYGFAEVISEYKGNAPKSAKFYAGVCELRLGHYEEALNYLKAYKGKDAILAARALACQGDALTGLDKLQEAVSAYRKAADKADNVFAAEYLLKAGVVSEKLGDKATALSLYKTIKDKYPQSVEGYDIDKYIARIEAGE